jgi:hypothetical protein
MLFFQNLANLQIAVKDLTLNSAITNIVYTTYKGVFIGLQY